MSLLLCFAYGEDSEGAGTDTISISARLLTVSEEEPFVFINRGAVDRVVEGEECLIRPNRGEGRAQIEWDIYYAAGIVDRVFSETSRIRITRSMKALQEGDYCEVAAEIPEQIMEYDVGRIAVYDIRFTSYEEDEPLFELEDLLTDSSKEQIDTILGFFLGEVHRHEDVADSFSGGKIIQGGMFHGMAWGEAFRKSTKKHIAAYLEYVSMYPGGYIGYDWSFIDTYMTWIINGTESGAAEKKQRHAFPYAEDGDRFVGEKQFQDAIVMYRKALKIYPEYEYAKNRIDLINRMLQHRKMAKLDERDVNLRYSLGEEYYDLGLYKSALEEYEAARQLGYEENRVLKVMGYTYSALGQYGEARKIFEILSRRLPKDENIEKWLRYTRAREIQGKQTATAESYVVTGDIKYDEQSYDDAIYEYNQALKLKPESQRIWERIFRTTERRKAYQHQTWAREYWDNGRFEDAKVQWDTAIEICRGIEDEEGVIEVLKEKGNRMYDWSFYDEAVSVYLDILDIDPSDYDTYISLSNTYESKGEYDTAVRWAERGIEVDPEDAWGYNVLGFIYLQTGRLETAAAQLAKSAELDPTYKYPPYNLGLTYVRMEEYEKAREQFLRCLEIDKDYWDSRHNLVDLEVVFETLPLLEKREKDIELVLPFAQALYDLEDYPRAMRRFEKILEMDPDNVTALTYMGYSSIKLEEFSRGKVYLERANRVRQSPDLHAWLLHTEGKMMLSRNPENPEGYIKLGEEDLYWEDYDEALSDYEYAQSLGADPDRIFELMERVRRGKEAKRFYNISDDYYRRGDFAKALEYVKKALAVYREIGNPRAEFWSELRAGWYFANLYDHESALERYEKAGEISRTIGDETLLAYYFSSLADYYSYVGDYQSALDYKEEAGALYRRNTELLEEARVGYLNAGYLYGAVGEFESMIDYYQKALKINRRVVNYTGEAETLAEIGGAYANEGDYSGALRYLEQALENARTYQYRWAEMRSYVGLGNIYLELGSSEKALKAYRDYLELAVALGLKSDRCIALNNIGLVYLELKKDYDAALPFFEDARNVASLIGYALMEGVAYSNIGVTYSRQGRYKEALEYHEMGLETVRRFKHRYTEMQALNEIGETYYEMGRLEEALKSELTAVEIAEAIGVPAERWVYELAAGKVYEKMGEPESALLFYKRAAETVSGIKTKIKSEQLREGYSEQDRQIEVYKRLIDLLFRQDKPEEAFRYIEESKSKMIRDAFGDIKPEARDGELQSTLETVDKMEKKKEALEEQIREEKKKPESEQDEKKLRNLSNTLATTEGEFNQWMLKLKFQNRLMYDALTIKPTTLGDVQQDIPAGSIILEYFISDDRLYIFCIGTDLFFAKSVEVAEEELEKLVKEYIWIIQNPSAGRKSLYDRGSRLYNLLVAPVGDVLEGFENVVIVPFGVLYYLPFQALVKKEEGKWEFLIEEMKISYTTSATFTDLLKNERRELERLIAIGNPDGSLPGASEEVRMLRDKIYRGRSRVWTREMATKENFFNHAKDYNIIHLATHGLIQSNPLESYLLFAGTTQEEQRMTLLEVAGYTALREKTGLVFLSACETAMESGRGSGSELISLAEAFAMAGAPTLIATLWEVDDDSTGYLVEEFYTALSRGGIDKIDALRQAQLSLIESGFYDQPFHWAPFIMIGNWR